MVPGSELTPEQHVAGLPPAHLNGLHECSGILVGRALGLLNDTGESWASINAKIFCQRGHSGRQCVIALHAPGMPHSLDAKPKSVHQGCAFGSTAGACKEKIADFFRTPAHFAFQTGGPGYYVAARPRSHDADIHPARPRAVPRQSVQGQNGFTGSLQRVTSILRTLGGVCLLPRKQRLNLVVAKEPLTPATKAPISLHESPI